MNNLKVQSLFSLGMFSQCRIHRSFFGDENVGFFDIEDIEGTRDLKTI